LVLPAQEKPVDSGSSPPSKVQLAEGLQFADPLAVRSPRSFLLDVPVRGDG